MKRILDEDDLIQIKKDIQEIIDENKFDENYATSDRKGGAAVSTKVEDVTTGDFRILLTDDHVDNHDGKQVYQDTALTYNADTKKIDINVTHADTANYFSEAKKIELSGDVTGSALSTGESGWDINTSLKKIIDETTAGPNNTLSGYTIDIPYIEVDEKGRIKELINKIFTVPQSTLEDFGDGTKHYGWNGTTVNNNIVNNNEGETFNSQLSWGSTIKIPNFLVDNKGRVQSGWTSKYKLPAAPATPEIPAVSGVSLTGDVTGEGTFDSNGNCSIATSLALNQTILSETSFQTGEVVTYYPISAGIDESTLILCWFRMAGTNEDTGTNTTVEEIGNNFSIIVPVQLLKTQKTLSYPIYCPYLRKPAGDGSFASVENGSGSISIKYDTGAMIIGIPGYSRGDFIIQRLL